MIVEPEASSGSMLSLIADGTASQINTHLKIVENRVEDAVSQANKLIEDVIMENE